MKPTRKITFSTIPALISYMYGVCNLTVAFSVFSRAALIDAFLYAYD